MTDEEFIDAALDQQSPETLAAARAALITQAVLGVRLDPSRVEAFADEYRAPRGAVLALLGWAFGDQPGQRHNIFTADYAARSEQREARFATGAAFTLARTVGSA
ncbi:hypothetical protein [Hyphomonas sp. ND6WE1B]|uniref:hypothetical protein n=1 Tax=Hyphomonas sp. ND6WE1B TaxID=1848191 RepID=UPI0008075E66|nr:hypothetical protein [Hyphomonas sp. ND6WE1B]